MKWGRKKAFSNSSSSPSLINHVFSASWLKRLKLKSGSAEPGETKVKQKGKLDVKSLTSSRSANWNEGRFYSGVDDLYWRLSFGDEGFEEGRSTGGVRSLWYDSDDELEVPMSSCNSSRSRSRRKDSQRFKDIVSEMSKMRVMECNVGTLQEKDDLKGTQARETKFKARKEKVVKKAEIKRGTFKTKEEALESAERIIQMKDEFQKPRAINSRRQRSVSCPNYSLRTIGEDWISESEKLQEVNAFSEDEFSSDWKKLNNMRTKDIRPKNQHRRKSVYIRRGNPVKGRKANARIKACSSRTAAKNECKIKALEDMKKAKKTRKKMEGGIERKTDFDGYAVIKSSFDPQQDFRDSMLEMIIQKEIKHPEELEELLVCYLTLNCSQYHDLIIKVFRQVWFEVNRYMFKCQ